MWEHYASLAAQYYVSGRFAAQAGYIPLCGNLIHHAIELQLKCGLIKAGAVPRGAPVAFRARLWQAVQRFLARCRLVNMPPEDADRYLQTRYRHSLRKGWRDFKRCHATQDLSGFDQLINGLDRWEEIRYPRQGIAMLVQRMAAQSPIPPPSGPAMRGVRVYILNVEQLDLFVQRMWSLMRINSEFFRISIEASHLAIGASVYEDQNVHMIYS